MIKKIIIPVIILFIFVSCDENIVYKAPFKQKPVLYCVINADSSVQFAMLQKSFNDKDNPGNNYIKDAEVRLTSNNQSENLIDTSVINGNKKIDLYVARNFKPELGSKIKIEAKLSNGQQVSSSITLPEFKSFLLDQSGLIVPPVIDPRILFISWTLRKASKNLYFLPRLTINYKVRTNKGEEFRTYEIPLEYIEAGKKEIPIYPHIIPGQSILYFQKNIETAFREISKGDSNKSFYTIQNLTFEVIIMEKHLAQYAASIQSFENSYSVKIYEPLVSNIKNGIGVFGGYAKRSEKVPLDTDFVLSFGYKFEEQ